MVTEEGALGMRGVSITGAGEMRTAFWERTLRSTICFANYAYAVTVSSP